MEFIEVTDQLDKIFILTLLTFHKDKVLDTETILKKQHQVKVMVGQSTFKQPEFFLKIDETDLLADSSTKEMSLKKCMNGLTESFKHMIEKQAN
jgi:tRNA-dihydrouridine synthase